MMRYESWKYYKKTGEGFTTPAYSHFFQYHLAGTFFSQKGIYKRLNWIWFGLLAGFLTWCLDSFFSMGEITSLTDSLKRAFDDDDIQRAEAFYLQIFVGLSMGIALGACLSFVEEYGQSRKISIFRVLSRVLIGAFLGTLTFFLLSILTTVLIPIEYDYIRMVFTWTIFGAVLGFVLGMVGLMLTT